tara:strand:+ start:5291 stop:5482 length:192 start_codon:yes stop_codon:yes gene_type:complete
MLQITKALSSLIEKHKERQLEMERVSTILGIDISFSDEELTKFIEEDLERVISQSIMEELVYG